ncbi:MAG: bZIP transcription factor [Planctomycetota bacterium]
MVRIIALLLPALLALPVHAQDEDRIRALEERVAALERENAELKRKVQWLERLRFHPDGTKEQAHEIRIGGRPDRSHLDGIELPEDATREQARRFVGRVLAAADAHRDGFGSDDPEVALLARVGPAHVDALIEPLVLVPILNGSNYLVEALKKVTTDQHKELVLKNLASAWELIEVVLVRGWTKDAAPILLRVLADREAWSRQTLPPEWIEAVVALERADTKKALRTYFYYGQNRYLVWKSIRRVPGLDLREDVSELWRWAKKGDEQWVRSNVAAVAAHYGHADALAVLFEEPTGFPEWETIQAVTPYRDPMHDETKAKKWFAEHRDRLVFDPKSSRFRLRDAAK